MSPTLIDEPLCKTGINQRCTFFFLGKRVACLSAFAPRKPCQYYLFWTSFFVELSHQGQILKLISKSTQPNPGHQHLTLSHLQFRQIKTCVPNLEISTSLQNWRQKTCTKPFIIFVESKSRTKSPAHQGTRWNWLPKRLPNPGNQHLALSNLCSWNLEGKPGKITSVPANLDRWISLRKLALKVRRNCVLGKIVMTCLSTLSPLKTFQSGQLIWGMQKKSMAKIQEVHGFIRFTDKNMYVLNIHNMPKIFWGAWPLIIFERPKCSKVLVSLVQVEC